MKRSDDDFVRVFGKPNVAREVIEFWSIKMKTFMFCESRLERLACLQREFDDSVLRYVTQPKSYFYEKSGKTRRYTPDALILSTGNAYHFEEIKPQKRTETEEFKDTFPFIQAVFSGLIKVPLHLNTVNAPTYLDANLSELYLLRRRVLEVDVVTKLVKKLPKTIQNSELQQWLVQKGYDYHMASALIAHGVYQLDHQQRLSPSSILERAA
jgi:hypothetical protein